MRFFITFFALFVLAHSLQDPIGESIQTAYLRMTCTHLCASDRPPFPTNWEDAHQQYWTYFCGYLGNQVAVNGCTEIGKVADLTASYPKIFSIGVRLKDDLCKICTEKYGL